MSKKKLLRNCNICGKRFFTEGEKRYYDEHNLKYPKLCKSCRELRKQAQKEMQRIEAFYKHAKLEYIKLADLEIIEPEHTLVIIGNGFDKMHGVPSGYYNFRDSMGKRNRLRENLEMYIDSDDVWGNFEENLAKLDSSLFYEILDDALRTYGSYESYKRDGSIADIMVPAEMLMNPVDEIVRKLPKQFRKWVNELPNQVKGIEEIYKVFTSEVRFLNFNYTEYLETAYGIDHNKVTYIHGYRKNEDDILVVGHAEEDYYVPREPKGIPHYKDPDMCGVFAEASLQIDNHLNWYEDAMTKHTKKIIEEHKGFFEGQTDVQCIITLGHSLSSVDWPYFEELIKDSNLENVNWMISFYSNEDLVRIFYFIEKMNIKPEHITLIDLH